MIPFELGIKILIMHDLAHCPWQTDLIQLTLTKRVLGYKLYQYNTQRTDHAYFINVFCHFYAFLIDISGWNLLFVTVFYHILCLLWILVQRRQVYLLIFVCLPWRWSMTFVVRAIPHVRFFFLFKSKHPYIPIQCGFGLW